MYEASALAVSVRGRRLIDAVDIAIAPGRFVVVIGPNGAGKSTLLRTLAGERRASHGSVRLHGRDIATLRPRELAAWRAVLAQSMTVTFPYTVSEVVRLGAPVTATSVRVDDAVARALDAVYLLAEAERPITQLSGGEQQRVHLARVLVQLWAQPDDGTARYLLLDEPTTHLDPAHQILVASLARAHASEGGGVLAVLHDLNLAAGVADEIVVMQNGRVTLRGAPRDVLTEPLLREVYGIGFDVHATAGRNWITPSLPGGTDLARPR